MRIATFNVNSVRSRLPILERWLNESSPDLLFLQETKTQDEFFPEDFFHNLGYESIFCGEKSYNGVAAIAKESLGQIDVSFGFNDGLEPEFNTRVILVNVHWQVKRREANVNPAVPLKILNTYVPQGKSITHYDFQVKKDFLRRVRKIVEREYNGYFAWLGDLNVAPERIDLAHPDGKKDHVCFCDEIRECFADTKKGLTDLLRLFKKNEGEYTFFDYRVKGALERNIGWRIDHILVSPMLAELAKDCFIDTRPRGWDRPSDHVPLIADF